MTPRSRVSFDWHKKAFTIAYSVYSTFIKDNEPKARDFGSRGVTAAVSRGFAVVQSSPHGQASPVRTPSGDPLSLKRPPADYWCHAIVPWVMTIDITTQSGRRGSDVWLELTIT